MPRIEKGAVCPNCTKRLNGENFCPNCGQLNNRHKPGFWELVRDVMSTTFGFDSKFWRSIVVLYSSPGKISKDYMQGKRARYMPPMRMFILLLFISILLNQLIGFKGRFWSGGEDGSTFPVVQVHPDTTSQNSVIPVSGLVSTSEDPGAFEVLALSLEDPQLTYEMTLDSLGIQGSFWTEFAYHRAERFHESGMSGFTEYLFSKIVWIMIFFLPLVAFILKVHYLFTPEKYYVDHLVFATFMQTAFIGFMILEQVLELFFGVDLTGWFIFGFAIYLYFSLLRYYEQGKGVTLLKFISLNFNYFIVGIFFLLLIGMVVFLIF